MAEYPAISDCCRAVGSIVSWTAGVKIPSCSSADGCLPADTTHAARTQHDSATPTITPLFPLIARIPGIGMTTLHSILFFSKKKQPFVARHA